MGGFCCCFLSSLVFRRVLPVWRTRGRRYCCTVSLRMFCFPRLGVGGSSASSWNGMQVYGYAVLLGNGVTLGPVRKGKGNKAHRS
ncbi:uncharacterized protein LY79DRAFT_332198 [Colletotrichum navitas]|uniref:Secreted protein n=1 Tax=Colletotrichum navitas TaxID=681940 RepID=A0AAD8PTC2_9PEZI|nr:uncharacterized protein LY79DRAFT_332198 [Colletotrichum navitas]KAK1579867.1 hypothetical protein LY79DRAFT_332198 [Colletotrichum navitas]